MPQPKPDLKRLVELQRFILDFQSIKRGICYPEGDQLRYENDVEHSYSLALMGWFLAQHFPELDTNQVIRMALVHDLLETYAGDTWAYDSPDKLAAKAGLEAKALNKLKRQWSDFPDMLVCIDDYETHGSEEANFVYALDKIMPILLNITNDGVGWKKHGITFETLHAAKKDKVKQHSEVEDYYKQILVLLGDNPHYFAS